MYTGHGWTTEGGEGEILGDSKHRKHRSNEQESERQKQKDIESTSGLFYFLLFWSSLMAYTKHTHKQTLNYITGHAS